ncbi:secreted RxLR effector protein 161-like [Silene latifolia]|uniref:secreted RxLR effector protein 161-like n=1 Tax=Silene latifolia TaxID=37657 RepID=UPI003D77668A
MPHQQHLRAVRRILKYVAGTTEYGIFYSKVSDFKLVGYTDSDWAGCLDDRKSTSGYVFTLGSGAISWSSKKQETVALSSSEAEYAAISSATCQAIWLRRLLKGLLHEQKSPTIIYCDNKAAISLTKNAVFHSRTKHIDIRHHFIRDMVAKGMIELKFCGTNQQIADILTKSLSIAKVDDFRSQMGVCKL